MTLSLPHPFAWIAPAARPRVFAILTLLSLLVLAALQVLGAPLRTAAAPSGIIAFELAGNLPAAQSMLASWSPQAQVYAGLSLGLDFLFMPLYAGAIGLGCVLVATALCRRASRLPAPARRAEPCPPTPLVRLGVLLAWGQIAAMLLDATENFALIRLLLGYAQPVWPILARWCALPKFALVLLGLLYVLLGALLAASTKPRLSQNPAG